jgi:hypothetical protein
VKVIGTNTSCERSSRRVWSAKATTPHRSFEQSMRLVVASTARTSKGTTNVPPDSYGMVRPIAYPGGLDEIHCDNGDDPSTFTPPMHRRFAVHAAWLHTNTYTPLFQSNPLPRTVIMVPDGLRPDVWLSVSRGVPDDGDVVVGATTVVDGEMLEAAVVEGDDVLTASEVVGATSELVGATDVDATSDVVTSAGASLVAAWLVAT